MLCVNLSLGFPPVFSTAVKNTSSTGTSFWPVCVYPAGACHCQMMDLVVPGSVDMTQVKFGVQSDDDCMHNFGLLCKAFDKSSITKVCYRDKLQFLETCWLVDFIPLNLQSFWSGPNVKLFIICLFFFLHLIEGTKCWNHIRLNTTKNKKRVHLKVGDLESRLSVYQRDKTCCYVTQKRVNTMFCLWSQYLCCTITVKWGIKWRRSFIDHK